MTGSTSRVTRSASRRGGNPERGSRDPVRHEIDGDSNSDCDSEQSEPYQPKPKRARISSKKGKAARKKHAQGEQGTLEVMMKMPIGVFAEIASYLTPADLISLVRTNKPLRSLLLKQPAVLVWQRAEDNVPGLPTCLTGMSEPEYAALLFSKYCTLCGASAMSKPDAWLRVRLCVRCRKTELGNTWAYRAYYREALDYVAKSKYIHSNPRDRYSGRQWFLDDDAADVMWTRKDYLDRGDHDGLERWQDERIRQLVIQAEEGEELWGYIEEVEEARALELSTLKAERLQLVSEKLESLGWEEKYLDFTDSPDLQKWNSLAKVPKPFTERIWKNLLPKLIPLLEDNRIRVHEYEKQLRKDKRCEKISELMGQLKENTYPYHAIVQALNIELPDDNVVYSEGIQDLVHPFPSFSAISGSNVLSNIYTEEHSLEKVEEMFNLDREEINRVAVKWREEAEDQLVGQYILDSDDAIQANTNLTIRGSTDATKHLSPDTRFLLRADTIFAPKDGLIAPTDRDQEHGPLIFPYHFPEIVASTQVPDPEFTLDQYVRNPWLEKIAKALLRDIGMPDAAYVEMNMEEKKFACGRCRELPCGSWEDLITHYHTRLRRFVGDKFVKDRFVTRHPVAFLNQHCLQTGPDTKPLARILSSDEIVAAVEQTSPSEADQNWCLICSGVGHPLLRSEYPSMEYLREHLREGHGITQEPVHGLHYTAHGVLAYLQTHSYHVEEWQKEWDAFYDAKAESSRVNNVCEPGPSS